MSMNHVPIAEPCVRCALAAAPAAPDTTAPPPIAVVDTRPIVVAMAKYEPKKPDQIPLVKNQKLRVIGTCDDFVWMDLYVNFCV